MTQAAPIRTLLVLCSVLGLGLSACAPRHASGPAASGGLDRAKLEAAVDQDMGGADTCLVVADTQSGQVLYQYGDATVCMLPLPPCETFEVVNDLIGLDAGVVTPTTVYKWDGSNQPVSAWQADANMAKAFKDANLWWDERLVQAIGHDQLASALARYGYGDHNLSGAPNDFWNGPQAGGQLGLSTRQQVDFIHRLYAGQLPAKPASVQAVEAMMSSEARPLPGGAQAVMTGKGGSCPSLSDGSRGVGWWTGRLVTPQHDVVFAASVAAAAQPSGDDIADDVKNVFADAGLWPQEQ